MYTIRMSMLAGVVFMFPALLVLPAAAQSCRWAGTAPLCSGTCSGNETEITRLDKIPDGWTSPFVNINPPFGDNCGTGTKALCCTVVRGTICRWDGTAPFCKGGCRAGETKEQPPEGSSSGEPCWSGSKAYCCHSVGSSTSTTGLPLVAVLDDVIYGVASNGDLDWFRHIGREDGTFRWAFGEARKVGGGWNFKHIFSGGDGIIYVINQNNDLMWYRHDGRNDGSFKWAFPEGKKVGVGWNVKHIFYGGNGVIYVINQNNDLIWYRHEGRNDGTFRWTFSDGKKVGNSWNVKQVFSSGDGIIYAQMPNNDLLWFRHDGRTDGSFRWGFAQGKKVGVGWNFGQLFTGAAFPN
jgi:hypothetical protein